MNEAVRHSDETIVSCFDPAELFLLHACCGPCLAAPAENFLQEGLSFIAWYHNPNIHPAVEHDRRRDTFLTLADKLGIQALAESASDPDDWVSWPGDSAARCLMCYRRRLGAAAAKTVELGLIGFTTTLLISPWQNHQALIDIGREVALAHGVRFLYRDLRPLYKTGQQLARAAGLYRQRYCGCLPSVADSKYADQIRAELKTLEAADST